MRNIGLFIQNRLNSQSVLTTFIKIYGYVKLWQSLRCDLFESHKHQIAHSLINRIISYWELRDLTNVLAADGLWDIIFETFSFLFTVRIKWLVLFFCLVFPFFYCYFLVLNNTSTSFLIFYFHISSLSFCRSYFSICRVFQNNEP